MTAAKGAAASRGRLEAWVPGIRVLRTYERGWLSRDLIAGIVLVTLLVPQGMAYAELAGLPPITGLYTTVVCLVAYAFVGPSPVLVLGPDSSLGPMIAATILPLAAGDQEQAIALAGMLALHGRRGHASAPGSAKLGFVADLLSNPVRDRLPGRPRRRHRRRPAAEAVRVLDRRRRSHRRGRAPSLPEPRPDESLGAGDRPAEPRHHPRPAARSRRGRRACSSPSSSRSRCRSCSTWPSRACRSSASCRRASRSRRIPRVGGSPICRCCSARRSASRSSPSATRSRPRAASRTRGGYEVERQPGAGRHRRGQSRGRPVLRASRSAPAARARPSRDQSGAKTQLTGLVAAALVLLMLLFAARPGPGDAPAGAGGGRHRGVASACSTSPSCAACYSVRTHRVRARRRLRPRRRLRRRAPGDRHRGRPVGDVHLRARLGALLGGPGQAAGRARLPRRPPLPGCRPGSRACSSCAGRRRSSSPTPTCSATGSAS